MPEEPAGSCTTRHRAECAFVRHEGCTVFPGFPSPTANLHDPTNARFGSGADLRHSEFPVRFSPDNGSQQLDGTLRVVTGHWDGSDPIWARSTSPEGHPCIPFTSHPAPAPWRRTSSWRNVVRRMIPSWSPWPRASNAPRPIAKSTRTGTS